MPDELDATNCGLNASEDALMAGMIATIRACQPTLPLLLCHQAAHAAVATIRAAGVGLDGRTDLDVTVAQHGSTWTFSRRVPAAVRR